MATEIPRLAEGAAPPEGTVENEAAKKAASKARAPTDWYIINIALADDNEPERVFVGGCLEGDFHIKRGEDVAVPEGVIERLQHAVRGVAEKDESSESGVRIVQRLRFSYTIIEKLGPRVMKNGREPTYPMRGKYQAVGLQGFAA